MIMKIDNIAQHLMCVIIRGRRLIRISKSLTETNHLYVIKTTWWCSVDNSIGKCININLLNHHGIKISKDEIWLQISFPPTCSWSRTCQSEVKAVLSSSHRRPTIGDNNAPFISVLTSMRRKANKSLEGYTNIIVNMLQVTMRYVGVF